MKNEVSYSFHLSTSEHSITNKNILIRASKHNNRLFENKKGYDPKENVRLIGSDNIFNDMKQVYDDTFGESVIRHDLKIRGNRDKIRDYFEKISSSTKSNLGEEIIIMIGDKEFYENRSFKEHKEEYNELFKEQIERLQELVPDFKIANATIHYDEASPHVHIVGVPTKRTPDKNLEIRVSKENCFTRESLTMIQEEMRKGVAERVQQIYQEEQITEQAKQQGRNINFTPAEYKYIKMNEKELQHKYSERFKEKENYLEYKFNEQVKELEEKSNQKILEMTKDLSEDERKALLHQDYKELTKVYGKKMDNLNEEIKKIDIPKIIEEKKQAIEKKVKDELQEYLNKVEEEHKRKIKALNEKNEKDFQERKIENEKKMKILDSEINTRTKEKDDLIANKNFLEKTINSLRDIVRKTLGLKNLEEFEKYAEQVRINAIKIKETIEKVLGKNGSIEEFTKELEQKTIENSKLENEIKQKRLEYSKLENDYNNLEARDGNFLKEANEEYAEYINELYENNDRNVKKISSYEIRQRLFATNNNVMGILEDAYNDNKVSARKFLAKQHNSYNALKIIAKCIEQQVLPTREDLEDRYDEDAYER